jgi:hypothetical protein
MRKKEALEVLKGEILKFEGTRNTQWKFNIAVWTLLSLAIFSKSKLSISDVGCLMIGTTVIAIHLIFSFQVQKSLECSKKLRKLIHQFLNSEMKTTDIPAGVKISGRELFRETHFILWLIIQMSITTLLAIIFILMPINLD